MQTLTVKLENRLYYSLKRIARQFGKTPEEMTVQWVEVAIEQIKHRQTNLSAESALDKLPENDNQVEETIDEDPDPLLALAGTLEYKATDLSEQHDEYIGQALLAKIQGNNDE